MLNIYLSGGSGGVGALIKKTYNIGNATVEVEIIDVMIILVDVMINIPTSCG